MGIYTTEITSSELPSDNPLHQRLLKPYFEVMPLIKGDILEIGCGEGRGVELLAPVSASYTAIDKISSAIVQLSNKYPEHKFIQGNIPPILQFSDESFDTIVSFQVIEHIKDDAAFISEIKRLLRRGGQAFITTPNIAMTLTRNPWHIREYTALQLAQLAERFFKQVVLKGISGNEKVMEYYSQNKASVAKIMKWDILNLQYRLPAWMLRWPYEILNRMNRNKLQQNNHSEVLSISHEDYIVTENADKALDLFLILRKH
ncbi:MAG: class I SAM-dependent methyltransferase [Cyclobacteriaceae bacterium]|nr:class I SAM-dependent methyltransferase [Cyclobacteriaceae bacterium]